MFNTYNPKLKFTKELESNNQINFLDISLFKKQMVQFQPRGLPKIFGQVDISILILKRPLNIKYQL